MKSYFYLFILISLCFSSLNVQATSCENAFRKLVKIVKQHISLKRENYNSYSEDTSALIPLILLKELNEPKLSIKSIVLPMNGLYYGNGEISFLSQVSSSSQVRKGQPEYLSTYIPSKKRKEKGHFVLSFRVDLNTKISQTYQHLIYWPSNAKKISLNKDIVKEIFNEVYRETYGESLDWIIAEKMISKTITYNADTLNQFSIYHIFDFNSLFFKDKADRLKYLITRTLTHSDQISLASKTQEPLHIPSYKMSYGMRRAILRSYTVEELKTFRPEKIKTLEFKDVLELFDTPEKIQILDMSLLSPKSTIKLLTEYPLWRESITPSQIKQLNVNVQGIQYVFASTFKDYTWRTNKESAKINIDNLSNEQIISLNKDSFLRDVFLAGDLYVAGFLPSAAQYFMILRKRKVKELGFDTVMNGSIPKGMHDFILKKLGFNIDFELMNAEKRRELFKAEIEMMTDSFQQINIIVNLVEENKIGNHNWF